MPEPWAAQEVVGAVLPDDRFRSNLAQIAESLASNGGSSYSVACGHGGRQSARRLFRNEATSAEGLLLGHVEQTAARCVSQSGDHTGDHTGVRDRGNRGNLVLCIQDTTILDYTAHRSKTGLGPICTAYSSRGLLAHSVLAMSTDGLPLGVLHLELWAREVLAPGEQPRKKTRRKRDLTDKESAKWEKGLRAVEAALPASQSVLLIQDREADAFDLLAERRRSRTHLLIRAAHLSRCVNPDLELTTPAKGQAKLPSVLSVLEQTPFAGKMVVEVGRKPSQPAREAHLQLQFCPVRVPPPKIPDTTLMRSRPAQPITLIRAVEIDAPEGVEPICWVLISTLPVTTVEEAQQMVRYYALRWTIERLHFTLKSGCLNVERIQIDDGHALKNALAVYYLVAWRILYLTHLARTKPDAPAECVLQPIEQQVLQAAAKRPVVTVADALREIARLAGYEHYANAPPPGVKRVWQGLRILETLTLGWELAHKRFPM
jgi:hypothetical protein